VSKINSQGDSMKRLLHIAITVMIMASATGLQADPIPLQKIDIGIGSMKSGKTTDAECQKEYYCRNPYRGSSSAASAKADGSVCYCQSGDSSLISMLGN